MTSIADDLTGLIAAVATRHPATKIAVAVSGGGDSAALLQVLARFGTAHSIPVIVATIDHGLRAASADEAARVAETCAALSVVHVTLRWTGWDGSGNLQEAARTARYRLLAEWALANDCQQVWLGHTADDQAETFLMRLARGSGVDGLAAIPELVSREGVDWVRPFLGVDRARLRDFLRSENLHWIDDPSNADPRFERIRFRNAAAQLAELGLTRERLNATARSMSRARLALERVVDELTTRAVETSIAGEVFIDPDLLAEASDEIRLRLLARALMWVSGAVYRPRLEALESLERAIALTGLAGGQTLHGCVVRKERGRLVVRRELARVAGMVWATESVWDGRWKVEGPFDGLLLGALGEVGLEQAENWRFTRLSREGLMTTPALWRDGVLVAAPIAGTEAGFTAGLVRQFA